MVWSIIRNMQKRNEYKDLVSTEMFQEFFLKKYDRYPSNEEWFKFNIIATNNNGCVKKESIHKIKNQNDLFKKFYN